MLDDCQIDKTKLQLKHLYVGLTATNPIVNDHQNAFALEIKRRQFPIRLAFAMTINKSQGQTFDKKKFNASQASV